MKKEFVTLYLDGNIYSLDVDDREGKPTLLKDFLQKDCIFVTYQITEIINYIASEKEIDWMPYILDFECLDKQIRQSAHYCEQDDTKWSVTEMLHFYLGLENQEWKEEDYPQVLCALAQCYLKMKDQGKEEWKRIENIELPVNKVLYEAAIRGITFESSKIEAECKELHQAIYMAKNKIQQDLGQVIPEVEKYLKKHNIPYHGLAYGQLKLLCKQYPELLPYRELEKAERNFHTLLILSAVRGNVSSVKPIFKSFGTRTSRIVLRDPALQNLNRKFRFLLKSGIPSGYRYLYVDYSQFEAGILAGLTQNKELIELYNKKQIYESIAKQAGCDRAEAKIHFYCYVYGGKCAKKLEDFFDRYCGKEEIERIKAKALQKEYISSPLGNKRIFRNKEDENKIINHYIQSTGSLIFKQALIDVDQRFGMLARLLLPLHDGALYWVSDNIPDARIINTYKTAFVKWVKGIEPIVETKEFFEKV